MALPCSVARPGSLERPRLGDGVRAALPYSPGRVRLNEVFGASTEDEAPTLSIGTATSRGRTWNVRNRLAQGLAEWASTTATDAEPGVYTYTRQQYLNGLTNWVDFSGGGSCTADDTLRAKTLSVPSSTRPLNVRVLASSFKPVSGRNGIANCNGADGWWDFCLTA